MAERKAKYETGKFADGYGPGGKSSGMWFVKRTVEEVIAYADSNFEAQEIAMAFKAKEEESRQR